MSFKLLVLFPSLTEFADLRSCVVTFHNARGKEDSFKLDKNGFEIVTLPERERDISTDDRIKEDFLPEVIDLIKKRFAHPELSSVLKTSR